MSAAPMSSVSMSGAARAPRVGVRMAQQLAETVREEILSGRLQPGVRLGREAELMERYGVSRPTLREGLRLLEADGFVRVRRGPGGGVFAARPGRVQLASAVRTGFAIAEAADSDVADLRRLLDGLRELPQHQDNPALIALVDAVRDVDGPGPAPDADARLDVA